MIDVKHLSKSFGDHLVLKDISEHIYPGDKMVIIGPSGSGKSTFLRSLNLLEEPTSGTITFDGDGHHRPQDGHRRGPSENGHGVPALQPLPQYDHPQEHHPRPRAHRSDDAGGSGRQGHPAAATGSVWKTRRTPTPTSSPAARSSVLPSSGRWP